MFGDMATQCKRIILSTEIATVVFEGLITSSKHVSNQCRYVTPALGQGFPLTMHL